MPGGKAVDLLDEGEMSASNAAISPDGRWLAYDAAPRAGAPNVYVRPFPDVKAGKWQVSRDGGTRPVWSNNGRELFILSQVAPLSNEATVMTVPIETGSTFTYGNPRKLFSGPYYAALSGLTYDVSPDGQRFLMIKDTTSAPDAARLVVVENWLEELKRRVPVK
jgi:hypothetical protein